MDVKIYLFLLVSCLILGHVDSQFVATHTQAEEEISATKCVPACGKFGDCQKQSNGTYKCECIVKYYGPSCTLKWDDDPSWHKAFLAFSIIVVIMHVIVLCWSTYQLLITFGYASRKRWNKWSIVTVSIILIWIGSFIRLIEYSVDPHAVREIFPPAAEEILYTLPLIVWISGLFGLFLYWIELCLMTGAKEIMFVSKLRRVLYVLIISTIILLLPVCIIKVTVDRSISLWIYNVSFAAMMIIFIILILVYGIRLRSRMKRAYVTTRVMGYKTFVMKMTIFMFVAMILMIATIVVAFLFLFFGDKRWGYFTLHFITRSIEFGMILICLYLFHRNLEKPTTGNNSTARASIELSHPKSSSSQEGDLADIVDSTSSEQFKC